jgi:hypothetical protein
MKNHKFQAGDYITHVGGYNGFEDAIVTMIDEKYYHLKIINGLATMPIKAEENYELKKGPKRLLTK